MVERCALSGSDLKTKFRTILLTSILVYILLFTQAPIPVCLDGAIIDSSTILITMYYCGYVGVRLVAVHGY